MSDRVAFARLDSEHELAELRRELGVVTDERDTALAQLNDATVQWQFQCDAAADLFVQNERLRANAVGAVRGMERARDERDGLLDAVRAFRDDLCDTPTTSGIGYRLTAVLAAGLAAPVGETPDERCAHGRTEGHYGLALGRDFYGEHVARVWCPGPALPVEETQR